LTKRLKCVVDLIHWKLLHHDDASRGCVPRSHLSPYQPGWQKHCRCG